MLTTTSIRWPSVVIAGLAAFSRSAFFLVVNFSWRVFSRAISSAEGLSRSEARLPSRITGVPLGMSRARGSMPATAGMSRERAMMAAWDVELPERRTEAQDLCAVQVGRVGGR